MKVLHISFNGELPTILTPRQPDGSGGEITKFSELLPARVSFAPTVQQCILGVYPNVSHFFEDPDYNYPYMDFYVYGATLTKDTKTIPQATLQKKLIDFYVTDEVAVIEPIAVELVGKIRFINQEPNVDEIWFHPWAKKNESSLYAGPRATYEILEVTNSDYDLGRKMPLNSKAIVKKRAVGKLESW